MRNRMSWCPNSRAVGRRGRALERPRHSDSEGGFSILELLVSVAIIVILMAMVFGFLDLNQKEYRSQQLTSEVSQGTRSAFEVMTQELNQAGFDPPFLNNRVVTGVAPVTGTNLSLLTLTCPTCGGGIPTSRIFYGSTLVIGNNCGSAGTACDQEIATVAGSSTSTMNTTVVPVVLANSHATPEAVFDRNFPFPTGLLYNNRPTSTTPTSTGGTGLPGPYALATNSIQFFGDIQDTGELYYGEYRLQCATPSGYVNACTSTCATGPFVLTRFLTKLSNGGVFAIPSAIPYAFDGATVSPIITNIQGACAANPGSWSTIVKDETSSTSTSAVYAAVTGWSGNTASTYVDPVVNPDGTPAMWLKMLTYGSCDASVSPCAPYYESLVTDVQLTLTVQESSRDPVTGLQTNQLLDTRIVPKNISNALTVAQNGGASYLPQTPVDLSTQTATTPGNTLPLGCSAAGGYVTSTQTCP